VRWSEACREAGFEPNEMQRSYEDEELLEAFAELIGETGHFPVSREVRMHCHNTPNFPSHNTFGRFGGQRELAARMVEFCTDRPTLRDVSEICAPIAATAPAEAESAAGEHSTAFGYVYLLKSGKFFKIGRTISLEQRKRQLRIQLPEPVRQIHAIKTDDPSGIEAYWHRRFAERRKNGEWFELSATDVSAFRRRTFM